ncbi:hypothetical protein [Streptomyces scabiei]|uniref:hypothetical protein n=1 Tax=Streptomyces scabiei TaxID=1930 RepID=UPI001B3250DA|nr:MULTISPECIES: hypothetical protein [Streptomyces]MBP5891985.1 hypothetical protein [Streptomyces sp. LBUM 1481]MBP5922220.1 hypothetical protein [Streptomyces sp. LBUM 1483]MDX2685620.1 hypothetical protein [Streptomyces scabiei]MDX2755612.1 hypothetical protein [Streptomyces scabiei]MDX2803505.1 hypothetical protein [Streptomyces scabiei]
MRFPTTTALCLGTVSVLVLTACSNGSTRATDPTSSASASVSGRQEGRNAPAAGPLSSAALAKRLLDEGDLGEGYARKAELPGRHDDVTVTGCPALAELDGDAAAGGSLDFPRRAKVSFTYASSTSSDISEELYSGTAAELSSGVGRIFEAMTSCSSYRVLVGSMTVTVTALEVPAPRLGEEQWGQLLTFTAGGRSQVVKQTAVRVGMVVAVVSGSPALVDAHVEEAVAKARVTT